MATHPGCGEGGAWASSWKTDRGNLARSGWCQKGHRCRWQCHFLATGRTAIRQTMRRRRTHYLGRSIELAHHCNILCVWCKQNHATKLSWLQSYSAPASNQPATQTRCRTSPSRCWWRRRRHCKHCPLETGLEMSVLGHPEGSNSHPDPQQRQRKRAPRCTPSWQHWSHRK